jgi:EAL domain-containing protein (putative c-di-GMP-specific phosphodiesterase class I)
MRRRSGVLYDRVACRLIALALVVAGASGYALTYAASAASPMVWHAWGVSLGVVNLAVLGVAVASIAQPLLALVQLRRTVLACLLAFAAAAGVHSWSLQHHAGWSTRVLFTVSALATTVLLVGVGRAMVGLRKVDRPAERYGAVAGAVFAVGQLLNLWLRDGRGQHAVSLGLSLVASGFLVAMVAHPGADRLGQRLHRHSDQPVLRSGAIGLGALVAADGLLVALVTITEGPTIVWWLGAAGALQLAVIIWAIARVADSGVLHTFMADHRMDHELRRAIREGDIQPHYQPILRTSDGCCVGFEALARWDHPRLGILHSSAFLPRALERGYVATIDRQMLQAVAVDLPELLRPLVAEHPFVSMNLSPWRLEQRGFALEVLNGLADLGVGGSGLVLEISATSGVFNWEVLAANVACLRENGLAIALDDFGDGCGDLGFLCELDVDLVKLNAPLIAAAMRSERGAAVMAGVIQSARATGARIVAEGVETFEWVPVLAELGIDYVQGFGIGYPAPVSSATGLRAWRG